tara:strand:+ start:8619 stop:10514 length:1896 start_codon:yes stop_codon:yes gene_type:complete
MGGGGTSINYPEQPTYGEGMREALEAQVALLTGGKVGDADFSGVGSLESLLPLEESIRRKTAQADTDILRQTMLAGDSDVTADEQGRITEGYRTRSGDTSTDVKEVTEENQFEVYVDGHSDLLDYYENSERGNTGIMVRPNETKAEFGKRHYEMFGRDEVSNPFINRKFPKIGGIYTESGFEEGGLTIDPQTVLSEPGTYQPGQLVRAGDGMVDLLGDTRAVQEFETRTATQADVDAGLADEVGKQFVTQKQTSRQAGFDERGNFLGAAALSEDIQRANLSRQREADLQDVARLEPLFGQIMEEYKPGTSSAITGAKDLIEEQKDNLLGGAGITDPAKVQAQGVQADALRAGLMSDAEEALGQGLTDREERQIAEAARARSTMMGRTFDQSGAIAEAQARVAEDNQRKMQNRGFAQSVLGQEAGIQTSDNTRSMQADQFNVASQMDAEKLRESLRQQGLLGYLDAASRVSQLENQGQLDPFQAILGRGGGGSLQSGQSVFGQAGYGLQSGPQYLNPESGLGFIQNQATNAANMYNAQVAADASRSAGIMGGLGSAAGGLLGNAGLFCWVAREVYGVHNPAWVAFRYWMFADSPIWFFKLYIKYGERFANFISDKPRIKARIRKWMDSKIGR